MPFILSCVFTSQTKCWIEDPSSPSGHYCKITSINTDKTQCLRNLFEKHTLKWAPRIAQAKMQWDVESPEPKCGKKQVLKMDSWAQRILIAAVLSVGEVRKSASHIVCL